MTELATFIEAWELFHDPVLAGALAGLLLGWLGVYVVLRRMVFLSAALSQAAGLGVTLAFFAHAAWEVHGVLGSPTFGALAVTLLTASLLLRPPKHGHGDATLGLAYLIGAAGSLALGTRIAQESHDIQAILFGSAVAVLPSDFHLLAVMTALVLGVHLWWLRGFVQVSFDRDGARVRGLPVRVLELLLLVTLALAISVCTRVLGALPVFAFSVLPAMAAVRVAANVPRALVIAALVGAASGAGGYLVAFLYQLPVGAAQALVAAGFVLIASLAAHVLRRRA